MKAICSSETLLGLNACLPTIYLPASPHSVTNKARNGPVYAGTPYRNFFLYLNFIPAFINMYMYYIHLSFSIFMTYASSGRSIPALLYFLTEHWSQPRKAVCWSLSTVWSIRVQSPARILFPLASVSKPALAPTQPPIQWVPGVLFPRVKRGPGDADHSPPASTEVKNEYELYHLSPPPQAPLWRVVVLLYLLLKRYTWYAWRFGG
jgi:hypothetical protein